MYALDETWNETQKSSGKISRRSLVAVVSREPNFESNLEDQTKRFTSELSFGLTVDVALGIPRRGSDLTCSRVTRGSPVLAWLGSGHRGC